MAPIRIKGWHPSEDKLLIEFHDNGMSFVDISEFLLGNRKQYKRHLTPSLVAQRYLQLTHHSQRRDSV